LQDLELSQLFPLFTTIHGNLPDVFTMVISTQAGNAAHLGADMICQGAMSQSIPPSLLWALGQPIGNCSHGLAETFAGGTTRVSCGGNSIDYRSLAAISTVPAAGYTAENSSACRPTTTFARSTRQGGRTTKSGHLRLPVIM